MTKKSGMLAIALAKVTELRAALDDRREKLCEARDTIEQLSAEALALRQGSDRYVGDLKASNDEVARQRVELHKYEGWIYNTDHLTAQISRLEAKLKFRTEVLQLWINNPVNTELDAEVKHWRHQFQILSVRTQDGISEIKRLKIELANVRTIGQGQVDKLQAQVKELIGQRDQFLNTRNVRLVGAKQRITELEAALNYFNGLHQTGGDHVGQLKEERDRLGQQLAAADVEINRLKIAHDSVKADFHNAKGSLNVCIDEIKAERDKFVKLWMNYQHPPSALSKLWNWLT